MVNYSFFIKSVETQINLVEDRFITVKKVGWINPFAEKGAIAWKTFFLPVLDQAGTIIQVEYKVNSNTKISTLKNLIAELKTKRRLKQIRGRRFGLAETSTITFEDQDFPIPMLSIYLIKNQSPVQANHS